MPLILSAFAVLAVATAQEAEVDCQSPGSTIEINICAGREVEAEEATLKRYTQAAYDHLRVGDDSEALIQEIAEGERLWRAYVDAACGAVYTHWSAGSIRGVMAASCRKGLVRERAHHIWREYLVSMEGSALLPEPDRGTYDYVVTVD